MFLTLDFLLQSLAVINSKRFGSNGLPHRGRHHQRTDRAQDTRKHKLRDTGKQIQTFHDLRPELDKLSGNDIVDGFYIFHADQLLVQTAVEERKTIRIQPHLMKYCGMHILNMQGVFHSS